MKEIRQAGLERKIPLVDDITGQFLYMICSIYKPKNILELGFGSGYSAFWMRHGAPDARIVSLEKDREKYELGVQLLSEKNSTIELKPLSAEEWLKECSETYDFVFIDAVKAKYLTYLKLLENHLSVGAVVVADNIFYRGLVLKPIQNARKQEEINALEDFCAYLRDSKRFDSVFLPVGDGISISRFKG